MLKIPAVRRLAENDPPIYPMAVSTRQPSLFVANALVLTSEYLREVAKQREEPHADMLRALKRTLKFYGPEVILR